MIRPLAVLLAASLLLVACGSPNGLTHTEIPPLGGQAATFDQAVVDPSSHRLYVSDSTLLGVDIFDVSQTGPRYLTTLRLGRAVHGLAVAEDLHKIFVGEDGGGIAVIEADPGSKKVDTLLMTIRTPAKKSVDLLAYDRADHLLIASSPADGFISQVDAIRNVYIKNLALGGGLEQPRYNPADGRLYLTNMDKDLVYAIDPRKLTLIKQWPVGMTCSPMGMDINPKTGDAMFGCSSPKVAYTLLWSLREGKVTKIFNQVADADQVVFDPAGERFLAAGTSSGNTAIAVFGGHPVDYQARVMTHADSRAVAYSAANGIVYTPDRKRGQEGLTSFPIPKPEGHLPSFLTPLAYLLVLLGLGLVVWYYGRRRQRERRLAGRPTYS